MKSFHVLGPVPTEGRAYVERAFEARVLTEILAGRWVLLLGPRQHGKTTGLLRIRSELERSGVTTVYLDLQKLPPLSRYKELLEWVAGRVARKIPARGSARPEADDSLELLAWLESVIPQAAEPITIIVDEAGAISRDDLRNAFYGQIRSIANEQVDAVGLPSRLRFIFSGTFRPDTLVDPRNSPFNVCITMETEDFTLDQARELAAQVDPDLSPYAEQAFSFIGGQPYLMQSTLLAIDQGEATDRDQAYEQVVTKLRSGEDPHFEGIFSRVFANRTLVEIVARMLRAGSIPYEPANADFKYLQTVGLARRDGNQLSFRSSVYAEIAGALPQLTTAVAQRRVLARLFDFPKEAYAFMRDPELQEIVRSAYSGAVQCYNSGSYRLSLVGFGAALEGVLMDWLKVMDPAELARKVGRHRFDLYEQPTNPLTWRLVTLIEVARSGPSSVHIVSPPNSLRDWRNLVHPGVAVANYRSEEQLEPEAQTASGMLGTVLRDIAAVYP